MTGDFTTIRTVGGMLPPDLLARVIAGDRQLAGLTSGDYHLAAGETPREAANRAWSYLTGVWTTYRAAVDRLPDGDPAVGVTREKWLLAAAARTRLRAGPRHARRWHSRWRTGPSRSPTCGSTPRSTCSDGASTSTSAPRASPARPTAPPTPCSRNCSTAATPICGASSPTVGCCGCCATPPPCRGSPTWSSTWRRCSTTRCSPTSSSCSCSPTSPASRPSPPTARPPTAGSNAGAPPRSNPVPAPS